MASSAAARFGSGQCWFPSRREPLFPHGLHRAVECFFATNALSVWRRAFVAKKHSWEERAAHREKVVLFLRESDTRYRPVPVTASAADSSGGDCLSGSFRCCSPPPVGPCCRVGRRQLVWRLPEQLCPALLAPHVDIQTELGKSLRFSVLDFKNDEFKPASPALLAIGLKPIKISKFLWPTQQNFPRFILDRCFRLHPMLIGNNMQVVASEPKARKDTREHDHADKHHVPCLQEAVESQR